MSYLDIHDFSESVLKVALNPRQEAALRLLHRQDEESTPIYARSRETLRRALPLYLPEYQETLGVLNACLHRRQGNTTLCHIGVLYEVYRLLSLGDFQKYFGIFPSDSVEILLVVPLADVSATAHLIKDTLVKVLSPEANKNLLVKEAGSREKVKSVVLHIRDDMDMLTKRPFGSVRIQVTSRVSPDSLRGRNILSVFVDDCNVFNKNGKALVNLIEAVFPSVAMFQNSETGTPFGKVLCAWPESFELYTQLRKDPRPTFIA